MFKRYLYFNYRSVSGFRFWFARRVTLVGWVLLGATLIAAALGVDPTVTVAYQTFTFLLFLDLIALLLTRFTGGSRIAAERVLPKFGSVDEPFSYSILLRNDSKRTQRSLTLFDECADPRPSFDQFASVPDSKLTNVYVDRVLGTVSTARNWRTVNTLLGMLDGA